MDISAEAKNMGRKELKIYNLEVEVMRLKKRVGSLSKEIEEVKTENLDLKAKARREEKNAKHGRLSLEEDLRLARKKAAELQVSLDFKNRETSALKLELQKFNKNGLMNPRVTQSMTSPIPAINQISDYGTLSGVATPNIKQNSGHGFAAGAMPFVQHPKNGLTNPQVSQSKASPLPAPLPVINQHSDYYGTLPGVATPTINQNSRYGSAACAMPFVIKQNSTTTEVNIEHQPSANKYQGATPFITHPLLQRKLSSNTTTKMNVEQQPPAPKNHEIPIQAPDYEKDRKGDTTSLQPGNKWCNTKESAIQLIRKIEKAKDIEDMDKTWDGLVKKETPAEIAEVPIVSVTLRATLARGVAKAPFAAWKSIARMSIHGNPLLISMINVSTAVVYMTEHQYSFMCLPPTVTVLQEVVPMKGDARGHRRLVDAYMRAFCKPLRDAVLHGTEDSVKRKVYSDALYQLASNKKWRDAPGIVNKATVRWDIHQLNLGAHKEVGKV
jgi:hypothetical protein